MDLPSVCLTVLSPSSRLGGCWMLAVVVAVVVVLVVAVVVLAAAVVVLVVVLEVFSEGVGFPSPCMT